MHMNQKDIIHLLKRLIQILNDLKTVLNVRIHPFLGIFSRS